MGNIYVVGLGPGNELYMTFEAADALNRSDIIIGYTAYIDLIREKYENKELLTTGMRREIERCDLCIQKALEGHTVSLVCSGDAGVYGMASLLLTRAEKHPDLEIKIVAGVTAALSGSALLGAPIAHDFCVISLSDLLTDPAVINNRLRCAAMADFVIAIYNPSSKTRPKHLQNACEILREYIENTRPCGIVRNIGRSEEMSQICTFGDLFNAQTDMFTTVFIGNKATRIVGGRLVTPRGYEKYDK